MTTFEATVPDWMVSYASLPGQCTGARGDELCNGVALGKAVLGDVPGAQFAAFAYCWRRFGPPWLGSDPHKDLVRYILGTPHSAIFLTLGLSASPLPYAVGYVMTETVRATFPHSHSARVIVSVALTAALRELLRPVCVRDVAINILGRVADDDRDDREEASPSPYAGYGIPQDALAYALEDEED